MTNQAELYDQDDDPITAAQPDAYTTRLLAGSLAPIMHPTRLAEIEANFVEWLNGQAWYQERRAREQASNDD